MLGVEVQDLTFRYLGRKRAALKRVSFSVRPGGSLLVLGPSGCGKSTLGLCLNGAIPHFVEGELSGRVLVGGRDTQLGSMADMAQRVGVVFQDPESQFCMLTLEEEIAFGLENLAVPRAEMDARIDEALGWVGLGDRRGDRIERLSGGQKQRLALACVLAQRPRVLVFDEPTAQLDPAAAHEVLELIQRLRGAGQHTLIVIEHRLDDLMPLVDDVLVLDRDGQVAVQGPPRQVMRDWGGWLAEAGVWVPQVSELASRLELSGHARLRPFPITVGEAVDALRPHATALARPPRQSGVARGTAETFLGVRDLSFTYPRCSVPALAHVSLSVETRRVHAVVGPNGAGKSTLAAHLVGIRRAPPGCVHLEGFDLAALRPSDIARQVGYVFQYPEHQFVGRSVLEDVAYGLRRAGVAELMARDASRAILAEFGLAELADAHPYSLSHGEQRRLSVAAMLVLGQRGLLLDEPTFGQDRRNAHLLLDKLDELARDGKAIVAITHDMRLVAERATHVVAMVAGEVCFDGSPAALFADPRTMLEARLRPPPLVEVGQHLGLPDPLLRVDDVVAALASAASAVVRS